MNMPTAILLITLVLTIMWLIVTQESIRLRYQLNKAINRLPQFARIFKDATQVDGKSSVSGAWVTILGNNRIAYTFRAGVTIDERMIPTQFTFHASDLSRMSSSECLSFFIAAIHRKRESLEIQQSDIHQRIMPYVGASQ